VACCLNQGAIDKAVAFLESHLKAGTEATAAADGEAAAP
jgi:hypothetical protein